ncbi:hypothetical protein HELRODRAFT_179247 [Helobdella robusta]|uniref:C-type lectin domain-containing protein n=1 Tax=Helobdella robusta TaxID=6412 RepID=T1FEF4_HELRO|nr:hypothetical protein HELRODRAFT_179247 [Helobdella robusta]ESN95478.1 hypothetical protein HELRODRAFT_179247 [Helobdella robusta]
MMSWKMFRPAYSFLIAKNQKILVCFDDQMSKAMTGNELRGVNYIQSIGSCSCVPKANIRYKVTTVDLMAGGVGCMAYVHHGSDFMCWNITDCPTEFDYVIEHHKCYKMQYTQQNWQVVKSLCNSISFSHAIVTDDFLENTISLDYVNFTYFDLTQCSLPHLTNSFGFFTSGIQEYVDGVRTFIWSPYPGIQKPVQIDETVWFEGEPNSPPDEGNAYCIQILLLIYTGWDDIPCSEFRCVLCELRAFKFYDNNITQHDTTQHSISRFKPKVLMPSEHLEQLTTKKFRPAFSYLIVRNHKLPACFDDQMLVTTKVKVRSLKECIAKCLVKNNNKLRGVNYVASNNSCSCFPIAKIRFSLISTTVAGGCRGFALQHALPGLVFSYNSVTATAVSSVCTENCPVTFDYILEYHKCYKMPDKILSWYDGRMLCNNISSSHPITVDDDVENEVSLQYVDFVTKNYQWCPGSDYSDWFAFYTSGIRTYMNGTRTPFLWFSYPGKYKTMQSSSVWHSGEPNSADIGLDYCVQSILYGYFGWDDQPCTAALCVLCEFDMTD